LTTNKTHALFVAGGDSAVVENRNTAEESRLILSSRSGKLGCLRDVILTLGFLLLPVILTLPSVIYPLINLVTGLEADMLSMLLLREQKFIVRITIFVGAVLFFTGTYCCCSGPVFPDFVKLLQHFGICFSTINQIDYCATSELDHLKIRTVISIPGGGPVYMGLCTVLFWMAHGMAKDVYDINVKYFDGSLLADLLLPLWSFISLENRYYFLKYLYTVTQRHQELSTHFASDNVHFQMFLDKLTHAKKPDDLIRKTTISTNLAPIPYFCPIQNE
jgi:hypothetical protein